MKRILRLARSFGLFRCLCLGLLVFLLAVRLGDSRVLDELRLRVFDMYQVLQPRPAGEKPVRIVDIDEKSLSELGQWPWPRTYLADLVTRLTDLGAAVVAFDVIFPEADRLSPVAALKTFRSLDEVTREKLSELPDNDRVFAEAVHKSRAVVGESALSTAVSSETSDTTIGIATFGDPKPFLLSYPGLLRNIPILEQAAAGRGVFTIQNERDGIVRRVPLVMEAQGQIRPSLAFEMLRVATGASTILIRASEAGIDSVAIPGFRIATDKNGQFWVRFGRHDPSLYISAADVLRGRVDQAALKDKLVIIGTSSVGLLDIKTTPIDAAMPGVEVHAQILESMLNGEILARPDYALALELIATAVIGILIIMLAPVLSPLVMVGLGAAVLVLLVGSSWLFYTRQGLLIDFTFPLVSSALIYMTLTFANYFKERSQRRRIRSAFGQYLAPALVEELARSPERLVLGGEQRTMTVMFSDVRDFTTIAESHKNDPQGLTRLMNRFLTPLTNTIIAHKGTIDKYMGDAIMAFWNAPLHDDAHEINACAAGLDMLACLKVVNRERKAEAAASGAPYVPIRIGIGLNTGTCVVGNIGSELRFDYSVLGDSVNLASRIEGQCKTYGLPMVIGSRTARAVEGAFAIVEIDVIAVKGKAEPETIYAVLGREKTERYDKAHDSIAAMLRCYRARDWDGALVALEAGRGADSDGVFSEFYRVYEKRILAFRDNPPPEGWNGVFVLETK